MALPAAIVAKFGKGFLDEVGRKKYIDAAFRSSRKNRVYIFTGKDYYLIDYVPGTSDDRIIHGPTRIREGYPSLRNTPFGERGIDCAFGTHSGDEAFVFYSHLCAKINYAPGSSDDWIIKGPVTIGEMFPFFKGTAFEDGVDTGFESSNNSEAYLFKGDKYALINYAEPRLIEMRPIIQGFRSWKGTPFEDGIDAAFASHLPNEAYVFKGWDYARIKFVPGTSKDYLISGVKNILLTWPSLRGLVLRKNCELKPLIGAVVNIF